MTYSSHVAHEHKTSEFFSFSLRDLPLVYIMHVMQFLPGYQIYMNYLHKLFNECEQLIVAN